MNIEPKKTLSLNGRPFSLSYMDNNIMISHYLICRSHPTIIYVESGETSILISNSVYKLKKGDFIFINSFEYYKHIHTYDAVFKLFFLTFDLNELTNASTLSVHLTRIIEKLINGSLLFPRKLSQSTNWEYSLILQFENISMAYLNNDPNVNASILPFVHQLFHLFVINSGFKKTRTLEKRIEKISLLDRAIQLIETNYLSENCVDLLEK